MATRSEMTQAIRELAYLDPTSLLKAAQVNIHDLVAAWEDVLPADASFKEIKDAGLSLHREHPGWEIRAGEILARIMTARAERAKREKSEARRREVSQMQERAIKTPSGIPAEAVELINRLKTNSVNRNMSTI